MREPKEDSLYRICQTATDAVMDEGLTYDGLSVKRIMRKVKAMTSPAEWSRNYLFERVIKTFIAICLNNIGMRSGIKGKGVYFSEDTMNKVVGRGLAINEKDLAESYATKANDLEKRVVENTTNGQFVFDENMNLIEEMDLKWFVDFILAKDEEDAI